MKQELEQKLFKDHPAIFRQRKLPMTQTCMCWGIECGDGWYELLDNLCKELEAIHIATGIKTEAVQVKEKYGTLRFYHTTILFSSFFQKLFRRQPAKTWDDIIDAVVDKAESKSAVTCEVCGDWGSLCYKGYWYATRCESCAKKERYSFKKGK